jgi:hypothetical protein
MQINGRQSTNFAGDQLPEFQGSISPEGVLRVDDATCHDFWLEVLFTPEEILRMAKHLGVSGTATSAPAPSAKAPISKVTEALIAVFADAAIPEDFCCRGQTFEQRCKAWVTHIIDRLEVEIDTPSGNESVETDL